MTTNEKKDKTAEKTKDKQSKSMTQMREEKENKMEWKSDCTKKLRMDMWIDK